MTYTGTTTKKASHPSIVVMDDEDRTVVIYQQAILMVTVTEDSTTTAQAIDVELWEPLAGGSADEYETILAGFVEGLLAAPDRSHQ